MQYVEHHPPDDSDGKTGCIFCDFPAENNDAERLIAHRGELAYVILNGFPYNNGHVMVVPFEHNSELHELPAETAQEVTELTQLSLRVLESIYGPEGFNIGINQGDAAGAGIGAHLHQHIVPRWVGDTNFMSVVGDTRVLPEDLAATAKRLRPIFERLAS